MTNTREIMINAWEIARSAACKFGGAARQYIAGALRQAWKRLDRKSIARELDRAAGRAELINQRPATRKQVWFLAGLLEAAGVDAADIGMGYGHTSAILTVRRASTLIDAYNR